MASLFQRLNLFRPKRGGGVDRLPRHAGYYATDDRISGDDDDPYASDFADQDDGGRDAGGVDYSSWDDRLGEVDRDFARHSERKLRSRQRFWQPSYWRARRKRWWVVRILAAILALFILIIAWLAITAPLSKSLEPIAPAQITLVAADGTPIARNGAITDEPVKLEKLPPHVAQAFLSIEDRRFFSHWGVDPRGIARAAWTGVGGGSTITQQLAKFTFLTPERSLSRKAREMLIAFWLETWLTKEEILERYLSNAYFGDNLYGLRAASLHYFYRKPENLTLAQSAMLAGLVQAPSRYAPTRHYARAEKRMKTVVGAMVAAGYLTQAQASAIRAPAMDNRFVNDVPTGTYFADWALPEARRQAGGGYAAQTLHTTLDADLQRLARRVVARAPLGDAQVALVAMRTNGEVVAMIGGKDYSESPFNRATQARRQPGSTFKLFVYLAALRAGLGPEDTIANTAIEQGSYRPKNSNGRYSDSLTLEQAFATSSNVAAVRLFRQVGDAAVIETARDLGISAKLPAGDPSMALGTATTTLIELTAAYAGVAANDFPVRPRAFAAEEDGWFDWLWSGRSSLSGYNHSAMEQMLRSAVNDGTGRAAMLRGPNFGKTGTSQGNRDALFVGYAGDLVVGVWIGNDDNSPLNGVSGGGLPARIWRDFMRNALGEASIASPRKRPAADPQGEVEPLDNPDQEETIPLGDSGAVIRIREGEAATINGEVGGVPLELQIDEDGIRLEPGRAPQEQR